MNAHDPQIAAQLASIMNSIPGAKDGKMFGMPAYKVNGKLAVSMFESTVVAKLGEARAQAVIGSNGITPFEPMPGRVWKDWIQVTGDLTRYRDLMDEAVRYVAEHSE